MANAAAVVIFFPVADMKKRINTKQYALTAMLSALSVVLMLATYFAETASLSVAAVAALSVLILLCEYGVGSAVGCYAITAILSLLLCPVKDAPIAYIAFFGIYPMIKRTAEMKSKGLKYIIKGAALVIAVAAYTASTLIFFPEELAGSPIYYYLFVPVCIIAFLMYDKCLTLFIRLYALKLRPKIAKYL